MSKMNFIQWYFSLLRRDMKRYEEDEQENQGIYDMIKKNEKTKGKTEGRGWITEKRYNLQKWVTKEDFTFCMRKHTKANIT